MKENVERPARLIDISRLPLGRIENTADGGLRLGALATNAETAYNDKVVNRYPLLARAILAGASAQLRNVATNGGNLLQRTRCCIFTMWRRRAINANRAPAARPSAVSIACTRCSAPANIALPCIRPICASPWLPSTPWCKSPAATASARFRSMNFTVCRGTHRTSTRICAPTRSSPPIDLPAEGFADHYAYLKVRDRKSYAFALVAVAAAFAL